jgi:D-alanyl-D-alanine carboxypeptidase
MALGALRMGTFRLAPLAAGVCLAAALTSLVASSAQARDGRHWRPARISHAGSGAPAEVDASKFSAIVVDANTGRELYGVNENALRHPASVTKVMTLYLLFEQLERGNLTLSSRIPVSEHAAAQEPSKLGVPAGDTISVEDAIKAIVTRSANDMAVAVAEAVGQSENNFAALMTHKAHQIGMSRTLYRNASGLPNDEQLTTAHDLALLGRSLQERFPKYYHYFSMHEFTYDGEVIGSHNHLLGRVEGVDGIKTGYTRASGFNLLTSVHRDGRALVAVVMGGRSAPARDRLMERMIETNLAVASPQRTAMRLAESNADTYDDPIGRQGVRAGPEEPRQVAEAAPDMIPQGDGDDFAEEAPRPPAALAQTAPALRPTPAALRQTTAAFRHASPPPRRTREALVKAAALDPGKLGWKVGAPGRTTNAQEPPLRADNGASRVARNKDDDGDAKPKGGAWTVQVGATDDEVDAHTLLRRAKSVNRSLAATRGFTQKVRRDGDTLYRVRFADLDARDAQKACRDLRQGGFKCFATQD